MVRSGVFVGVNKTGNLQKLNDAAAGAQRMHAWALSQKIPDKTHAKLITDDGGNKVTPDLIFDAINEIAQGSGVDQLILYFAGHGVNINRSEHWLLTDAPINPNAAINVSGSVELARYCGIGHVVVISDACRVAPEGIQAQTVRGMDVFPNVSVVDKAKPVDQFFACVLGRTAAEIRDPAVAATAYCALYTGVLLKALDGDYADILEASDSPDDLAYYVRPVNLESCLEREIPLAVRARNLQNRVNQNPDAILIAHTNWIAKLDNPPRINRGGDGEPLAPPPAPPSPQQAVRALSATLLESAVKGSRDFAQSLATIKTKPKSHREERDVLRGSEYANAVQFADTLEQIATPFGPEHFETECGIKVRGSRIQGYVAGPGVTIQTRSDEILSLRLEQSAKSVLLQFDGGIGTVIPAIAGFLTTVSLQDGELVDVAYEPSANTSRWQEFSRKAAEIRTLRGLAASASHHGRFRLDAINSLVVARAMQYAKGIDPTLSIYAAYAYHDLQEIDRIRSMAAYQRDDLGTILFDVALLSRSLFEKTVNNNSGVVPFAPLFSQGWPLLSANRVRLHPALDGIESTMRESVWSLFQGRGMKMLENALLSGEVQ